MTGSPPTERPTSAWGAVDQAQYDIKKGPCVDAITAGEIQYFDGTSEGLESRTMIGQATGLLMAHEGLTSEEAFQKLVKVSQNANIKLREIAQRYVGAWEEKTSATNGTA